MTQRKLPLINSAHGSETRNIINELIKLFNQMGYTYDEALRKAHEVLDEAQKKSNNVLTEAARINLMNKSVQKQVNGIIADIQKEGVSVPELVQMRTDFKGKTYPVAKERLDKSESESYNARNLDGWELQNKRRAVKPLVTFIDDDGRDAVLEKLLPLSQEYGIPFVVASYVRANEQPFNNYMTKEDLKMLQDDYGWEISSHTYNHPNLGNLSDEEQEYELRHSKEVLESWGLNVSTICYPYDGRNQKTYDLTRKYYRSGRRTGGYVNTVPIETYEMRSTTLGSWFEGLEGNTLEYYKARVDDAIARNGWVIFMTHCADPDHDETQQEYLEETIKYIQQNNVDIVTYDEGLNRMGNIIDVGNHGPADRQRKHFVVGADGTVAATDNEDRVKSTQLEAILNDTPPSEIPHGYIYQTRVRVGAAQGLPTGTGGSLITNAIDSYSDVYNFMYQIYRPAGRTGMHIRTANNNDEWNDWTQLSSGSVVSASNEYTNDSPPDAFEAFKVTYTLILSSNATGFPGDNSGVLITNRLASHDNRFTYQEFHTFNSNNTHRRVGTSSGWGQWSQYKPYIASLPSNSVGNDTPASEFESFKISYCHISTGGASGLPTNTGGVLMTNRMSQVTGYAWQEYKPNNSDRKFMRSENSSGGWRDWKEFQMI